MAPTQHSQPQPKSGIKIRLPTRIIRAVARQQLGRERTGRQQRRWFKAALAGKSWGELQEMVDERQGTLGGLRAARERRREIGSGDRGFDGKVTKREEPEDD